MDQLTDLKQTALQSGATFFGVADLAPAYELIFSQGGERIAAFPRALSIGIELQHHLVDPLPNQDDLAVVISYRHHAYDVINQRLDHITSLLSGKIQAWGYKTCPVPASQTVDYQRNIGIFSNKLAASLAGLGWIGKSCLLVTPAAGPRVRWATVLTTAPFAASGTMLEQRCGECRECVDICPAQAFSGTSFNPAEAREVRFATHKCRAHLNAREEQTGFSVCGLCLYVCPHGRKAAQKLS